MNASPPEPACPHCELAVGWAFHCLEPSEEALFAGHLPDCAECRQTVQEAEEVGAAFAVTVPDAVPPESLQQRILAAADNDIDHTDDDVDRADDDVDHTDDDVDHTDDDVDHTDERAGHRAVGSGRRPDAEPLRRRVLPRPAWRSVGRVLTAAAMVALIAVAGVLGIRVVQLDAERDRVAQQLASMSQLVERIADPNARAVTLTSTDGRPMAMLVAEPGQVTLLPMGLPANSASQTYVLWGLGTGTPVALDAFDVTTDPTVVHTVGSVSRVEAFSAFAVSIEPGRTPPAAPSDVLATGEVDI